MNVIILFCKSLDLCKTVDIEFNTCNWECIDSNIYIKLPLSLSLYICVCIFRENIRYVII